ncbi:MAG TPA: dienelactone hydrolase family protein [Acidobacteriota bacterium]|nr:dienelactone hydrolase family protein [Acidobacteriota bacterium]
MINNLDPFSRGNFPVGVRTFQVFDHSRNCEFPFELWYPSAAEYSGQDLNIKTQDHFINAAGKKRVQSSVRDAEASSEKYPLIIFSHASGMGRRSATFLTTHLSSHGYIVAAMDHSELVMKELARQKNETPIEKRARIQALIANRVPDVSFLLDQIANSAEIKIDPDKIGIVGHSFGGWTALASIDVEPRIQAVVALAPGGASKVKPGIIPGTLAFRWNRNVPTLFLVAENDVSLPLSGMLEIFERTPATKRMMILRKADHLHFIDNVEEAHETVRNMQWPDELGWLSREMQPISELCTGEQAHLFVRGLAVCHFDTFLKTRSEAIQFFQTDVAEELKNHGVDCYSHE